MKTSRWFWSWWLVPAAVSLLALTLAGCSKVEQAEPESSITIEDMSDEADAATEDPAAAVPKDHPAH